MTILMQKH